MPAMITVKTLHEDGAWIMDHQWTIGVRWLLGNETIGYPTSIQRCFDVGLVSQYVNGDYRVFVRFAGDANNHLHHGERDEALAH